MRAWLLTLAVLLAWPARSDDLLLPEGKMAQPVNGPYTKVTVRAGGDVEVSGSHVAPPTQPIVPDLVRLLALFHAATPEGSALVAGDRRADFRFVRSVLASVNEAGIHAADFLAGPASDPPRAIRVVQRVEGGDPLGLDQAGGPVPLTLHLRAGEVVVLREGRDRADLPDVGGARDLASLAALLDEDRRLNPAGNLVVLNTDDGVPYGDTFALLDLTREKGYPHTLLAGGPPIPESDAPSAAAPSLAVEASTEVTLHPNGDAEARGADGALSIVRHDRVDGYEAWCDAGACDIVVRSAGRRVQLGSRPRALPLSGTLFGRGVELHEGRLGLGEPRREGEFSSWIAVAGAQSDPVPASAGAGPILLGELDKSLIDRVIKANMSDFRICYSTLLRRDRTAGGKIMMKFVIGADGKVSAARVKASEIADPGFRACMVDHFERLTFDQPKGGGIVIVSYPFIFSPG